MSLEVVDGEDPLRTGRSGPIESPAPPEAHIRLDSSEIATQRDASRLHEAAEMTGLWIGDVNLVTSS